MRFQITYFGIVSLLLMSVVAIVVVLQFEKSEIEKKFKEWRELKDAEKDFLDNRMKRRFFATQHDNYWILQNYVQADDFFPKNESITITTHGTYKDLHMLEDLLEYWKSPVSIVLFANDVDFNRTLNRIYFLRECSPLRVPIRYFVTFHLCIHKDHMPHYIPNLNKDSRLEMNCSKRRQSFSSNEKQSYWIRKDLEYPLNLMRNIARQSALSYYIMPLELGYIPSEFLMRDFLRMTKNSELHQYESSVYCIPVVTYSAFEIMAKKDRMVPSTQSRFMNEPIYRRNHHIYIVEISKSSESCQEAYITINSFQPCFDESIPTECILRHEGKPNILDVLNYNFIMMKGTAVGKKDTPEYVGIYYWKDVEVNCSSFYETAEKQWKLLYNGLLNAKYAP